MGRGAPNWPARQYRWLRFRYLQPANPLNLVRVPFLHALVQLKTKNKARPRRSLPQTPAKPSPLRSQAEFPSDFCFYRVNQQLFVCDLQADLIIILAVIHAAQDIPERLAELEPTLKREVEILHQKLKQARREK